MPMPAEGIRQAVRATIQSGARTFDICPRNRKPLSTAAFALRVIDALGSDVSA
ncbi:hypothetical protein D3C86_2214510 [compost metagenome]